MKRMKHSQHGFHHPMNSDEEQRMLTSGWVYDEPDKPPIENVPSDNAAAISSSPPPAEPVAAAPIKKKPGRPKKS